MAKPISFADLDQINAKLKTARGVLGILQDGMPTDHHDDIGWALCAVFDYVHEAMMEIDKIVDEARK